MPPHQKAKQKKKQRPSKPSQGVRETSRAPKTHGDSRNKETTLGGKRYDPNRRFKTVNGPKYENEVVRDTEETPRPANDAKMRATLIAKFKECQRPDPGRPWMPDYMEFLVQAFLPEPELPFFRCLINLKTRIQ